MESKNEGAMQYQIVISLFWKGSRTIIAEKDGIQIYRNVTETFIHICVWTKAYMHMFVCTPLFHAVERLIFAENYFIFIFLILLIYLSGTMQQTL